MSFADWVSNGWLLAHASSQEEIGNLLGIVARDLKDGEAKDVSDDWRFAIAYNAALAAGYRAARESQHYRVIHSLELTVGKDARFIRVLVCLLFSMSVLNLRQSPHFMRAPDDLKYAQISSKRGGKIRAFFVFSFLGRP